MVKLDHLQLFLMIVEKGSLAAAGRELGLSATTVSDRLASLEAHYQVSLLHRTTRAISLTEEGRTLLDGARQLLAEADDLDHRLHLGADSLSGQIRISTPVDLGISRIKPMIDRFLESNPKVTIDLLLSDGYINIVDEGIDIAVRFGRLSDSSLRSRRLGVNQRVVCATPGYIKERGEPTHPDDLVEHNCLLMRFGRHLDNLWHFREGDQTLPVHVKGNRVANDSRLIHDWGLAGHGIMLRSLWDVGEDLRCGRLVQLLHNYSPEPTAVQALFPPSRTQPRRVEEFVRYLVAGFTDPS